MNVQRLCPVYKKWLQLNPLNARQHRLAMQAQTQQAHQQGKRERHATVADRRMGLHPEQLLHPDFERRTIFGPIVDGQMAARGGVEMAGQELFHFLFFCPGQQGFQR